MRIVACVIAVAATGCKDKPADAPAGDKPAASANSETKVPDQPMRRVDCGKLFSDELIKDVPILAHPNFFRHRPKYGTVCYSGDRQASIEWRFQCAQDVHDLIKSLAKADDDGIKHVDGLGAGAIYHVSNLWESLAVVDDDPPCVIEVTVSHGSDRTRHEEAVELAKEAVDRVVKALTPDLLGSTDEVKPQMPPAPGSGSQAPK